MDDYTQMSVNQRIALILKDVCWNSRERRVKRYDMIADKLK
jgi:hypothetical protein